MMERAIEEELADLEDERRIEQLRALIARREGVMHYAREDQGYRQWRARRMKEGDHETNS